LRVFENWKGYFKTADNSEGSCEVSQQKKKTKQGPNLREVARLIGDATSFLYKNEKKKFVVKSVHMVTSICNILNCGVNKSSL
jgi:hypothetical protein